MAIRLRSLPSIVDEGLQELSNRMSLGGVSDPLEDNGPEPSSIDITGLSSGQAAVVTHVLSGVIRRNNTSQKLTLLHGGGGTGKSHVVRRVTREFQRMGYDVVNTCTTGAGATQIPNGRTFHSAFKCFRKNQFSPQALEEIKLIFTPSVRLVIIDEVSMLRAEFLSLMDERLRRVYRNDVPFGGISVLLVGDDDVWF